MAPGLNEEVIRLISAKKGEPEWLLEYRLKAYRHWLTMDYPHWANVHYERPDFQKIVYYSAPKTKTPKYQSLEEVDPELLRTFEKLGVPIEERKALAGVAVDVVFDSISVTTTYKDRLKDLGIIFCSLSEAVREHPDLVKKYLGSVVPYTDNFYAALQHIAQCYRGNAAEAWADRPSSATVVLRFLGFQGVGQKIATMAGPAGRQVRLNPAQ